MNDIVDRLRDRSYIAKARDPLCEEAAAEIERLRWRQKVHDSIVARMAGELVRLRDLLPIEERIKEAL